MDPAIDGSVVNALRASPLACEVALLGIQFYDKLIYIRSAPSMEEDQHRVITVESDMYIQKVIAVLSMGLSRVRIPLMSKLRASSAAPVLRE